MQDAECHHERGNWGKKVLFCFFLKIAAIFDVVYVGRIKENKSIQIFLQFGPCLTFSAQPSLFPLTTTVYRFVGVTDHTVIMCVVHVWSPHTDNHLLKVNKTFLKSIV